MFRQERNFAGFTPLINRLTQVENVLVVSADSSDAAFLQARLISMGTKTCVTHVLSPKTNAYEVREALLRQLSAQTPPPDIALMSAGPVGKCLVRDLLETWPASSQIIDTGHLFSHLEMHLENEV